MSKSPDEPPLKDERLSRWTHVRAAFVAFHIVAVVALALPTPGPGLRREAWKDPTVQSEFHAWAGRLDVSVTVLEERLWTLATRWVRFRGWLLTPFRPYGTYVGARQPWRMFVAPHRYPARIHIELEEGGRWRTLYIARSDAFRWRGRQLDHDRVRAALFRYGWPQYERSLRGFIRWLARRAAEEFPAATRLRTRMFKYRTLSPAQVRQGASVKGRFVRSTVVSLGDLR